MKIVLKGVKLHNISQKKNMSYQNQTMTVPLYHISTLSKLWCQNLEFYAVHLNL